MHSRSECYSVNIALWSTGYFLKLTYRASLYSFLLSSGITIETLQKNWLLLRFLWCLLPVPRLCRWSWPLIIVGYSPTDTEVYRVNSKANRTCLQKHFLQCVFDLLQTFILQQLAHNQRKVTNLPITYRNQPFFICLFCGSSLCCCDKWSTTWAGKIFGSSTVVPWIEIASQRRNS